MPTSNFYKFDSFVEAVAEKLHNLGSDQIEVALCSAANAPVASDAQLSDLTQISYTYCSARTVTTISSGQTSGLYKLILQDLTLSASGGSVGPFRYVILFNQTSTGDLLIGWYDYGSDQTILNGESLDIDFDGTEGAVKLQ